MRKYYLISIFILVLFVLNSCNSEQQPKNKQATVPPSTKRNEAKQQEKVWTWEKEPSSYRGVPWRATEKQVRQNIEGLTCYGRGDTRQCGGEFKLGAITIQDIFGFRNGQLSTITFSFGSWGYEYVKETFIEKYGPPEDIKQEEVSTRMGVKYQNESMFWLGKGVVLTLSRYGSSIDRGMGGFSVTPTEQEMEEAKKTREKDKQKALESL